jgi:hypothetical protein
MAAPLCGNPLRAVHLHCVLLRHMPGFLNDQENEYVKSTKLYRSVFLECKTVLTMVYNTQNYWVLGTCPSSAMPNTRQHDVWETGSVSVLEYCEDQWYSNRYQLSLGDQHSWCLSSIWGRVSKPSFSSIWNTGRWIKPRNNYENHFSSNMPSDRL